MIFTKERKLIVFLIVLFFWFSTGLYAQFQLPIFIRNIAFNPAGDRMIACADTNQLKILNAIDLSEIKSVSVSGINTAIYSPNGENIICALNNGSIMVLDKNGNTIKSSALGDTKINSIAFNNDGTILVSGSEGHTIRLIKPGNWNFYTTLPRQESKVLSVAFTSDNKVVAGLENGTIVIINIDSNSIEKVLRDKTGPVDFIFTNKNYSYFISGVKGKGFTAWNLSDYSIRYTYDLNDKFRMMTMSSDGRTLATLEDRLLKLWNPDTGDNITSGGGIHLSSDPNQYRYISILSIALNSNAETLAYGGMGFINSISFNQTKVYGHFEYQLIEDGAKIALVKYNGLGGEVTIPRQIFFIPVTKISKNTFVFPNGIDLDQALRTHTITKINIPDTVIEIEENAFVWYHKIEEIIIPNSVTRIGAEALPFIYLKRVTIGSNVNFIGGRLDSLFVDAYYTNSRKAGVYIRDEETKKWSYLGEQ